MAVTDDELKQIKEAAGAGLLAKGATGVGLGPIIDETTGVMGSEIVIAVLAPNTIPNLPGQINGVKIQLIKVASVEKAEPDEPGLCGEDKRDNTNYRAGLKRRKGGAAGALGGGNQVAVSWALNRVSSKKVVLKSERITDGTGGFLATVQPKAGGPEKVVLVTNSHVVSHSLDDADLRRPGGAAAVRPRGPALPGDRQDDEATGDDGDPRCGDEAGGAGDPRAAPHPEARQPRSLPGQPRRPHGGRMIVRRTPLPWTMLIALHLACNGGGGGAAAIDAAMEAGPAADTGEADRGTPANDVALSPDRSGDVYVAPPDAGSDVAPAPMGLRWVQEPANVQGEAIGGTGPNDVWVVSATGSIWHSVGDGTWTSRVAERGWNLTGIWGSGPNDVYVSVKANFVFHWNGAGWQKQTDGIAVGLTYNAIWGSGPADIYMADPSIYHSKGDGTWQGVNIPLGAGPFVSIWGSGPNDVWALGSGGVARWNGQVWKNEKTGFVIGVAGIWGSGPNDVYALYGGNLVHTDGGGQWADQPLALREADESMASIWGSGRDDLYIGTNRGRLLHRRSDGRWYAEEVDPSTTIKVRTYAIWGTSPENIYLLSGRGLYRSRPAKDGGI
jgi:hypothetical protein